MKSTFKKFLVATLSATMIMSSMVFADNPFNGDIETNVTNSAQTGEEAPIYYRNVEKVVVPTNLTVALNPQELPVQVYGTDVTSSAQILSRTVGIVNKGTNDKKIKVELKLATVSSASSVTFKDSKDEVTSATGADEYFVYLEAVPAKSKVTSGVTTAAVSLVSGSSTTEAVTKDVSGADLAKAYFEAADAATSAAVKLVSGGANALTFKLNAAAYVKSGSSVIDLDNDTTNNMSDKFKIDQLNPLGYTAFTITGAVNTRARWMDLGDNARIKITPVYTITDAFDEDEIIEGTAGVMGATSYLASKKVSETKNSVDVTLPEGVSLGTVILNKEDKTTVTLSTPKQYTYSSNKLTIMTDVISAHVGETITVNFSDKKSETLTIE